MISASSNRIVVDDLARGCPNLKSIALEFQTAGVPPLNFPELQYLR